MTSVADLPDDGEADQHANAPYNTSTSAKAIRNLLVEMGYDDPTHLTDEQLVELEDRAGLAAAKRDDEDQAEATWRAVMSDGIGQNMIQDEE